MIKPLYIGGLKIDKPLMLAPMAGIADPPFRTIVESFGGVGLMFSEMIPCRSLFLQDRSKLFFNRIAVSSIPRVLQIIGSDPYYMSEAARLISDSAAADIIDINFGCPVKKVVKGFAGAAMMRNLNLAREIIKAVVDSASIPVTIKMRLGWDCDNINAATMAKIAEDTGIKMITLHGRTRSQLYSGKANWTEIANVKNAVEIPIVVNGDIKDIESLKQALQDSGADGAMIARGACGRPWLFKKLEEELSGRKFKELTATAIGATVLRHFDLMINYYGQNSTIVPSFRGHLNYYSAGLPNSGEFRAKINRENNPIELRNTIVKFFR